MKRISHMHNIGASFSSSTSTSANRSEGALEYWSVGIKAFGDFRALCLELFAGSVMSSETVLPKAVETAGMIMPRLNSGFASDASPRCAATISLERRVVSKQ